MPAVATCKQIPYMVLGDKGFVSVSFDPVLDAGVTLTGTPTVSEVGTSVFTIGTPALYTGLSVTGMRWNATTKVLSKTGGFIGYEYNRGDTIAVTGGTNATVGTYIVNDKLDDNKIVLESALGTGTANQADIAGTIAASKRILGDPVRPNRSITVFLDSVNAVAGTTYRFRVTVNTSENSNSGVRIRDILLKVIALGTD
jgi:hypothetical protein